MTLQQFIDELEKNIQQFSHAWKECNKSDPDQYPLDLLPGDWDEQFFTLYLIRRE